MQGFEFSAMLHSLKLEKKWLMVGGSIGLVGLVGVSYWVYQNCNIKKEEVITNFLNKYKLNYEKSLIVKPKEIKQKHNCEETEKKIIKDFNHSISKFIYKGIKLEKFFSKVNSDGEFAKEFGRRFYDLFAELFNQFLKFIQEQIRLRSLPNYLYMIDHIFEMIFDQLLQQLKYSNQYECELLRGLIARTFNHMILSDLLHLTHDFRSSVPPSHAQQQYETNYFEIIIRYTKLMSIKTQEKFCTILQMLVSYDNRFQFFLQMCIAKNINFVSCIDSNFTQALNELSTSRSDESTQHNFHNQHISHRQDISLQQSIHNVTKGGPGSSHQTQNFKSQGSITYTHQNEHRRKLIPSPICRILSSGISQSCAQQMIQEGFAFRIIENLCQLSQKSSSDLQDLEKVLQNLFLIIMNIIENKQNNQQFFQEYRDDILELLLKSLAFQETNETTTVSNSNIVDLVNWMTFNIDIILIRAKCSTWIQKILTTFLCQNKTQIPQVGPFYLQEIRWIHKIRRDDKLKGFQQLETDLSITTLFLHLILNSMQEVPHMKNINQHFIQSIPFADDQERFFIIKSFSSLLHNYVFMKELFISMLEKSCQQSNHLILTFTEFKNFFYSPEGKKYDEVLLALQLMILLGGGDSLCDTIVQRWQKDAEEYDDFKIYMSSDIAFLLQLLENDICYLNVNANWQEQLKSYESKANYRNHAYMKVQKLIINYLQIFGPMEKDNIKDYIQHQISQPILDSDNIFESALEEVAEQTFKTNQGNGNLYYSNHSSNSQHTQNFNTCSMKFKLKEEYKNKYFHSLFNRDIPQLLQLLNKIQLNSQECISLNQHDLNIESQLNERDQPMDYLKQVRKVIIENINLHTNFLEIFIENIPIFLEKLRVVCRILNYIFDVIEEGILDCRASKKLQKDSIKSLLVKYIFNPSLAEKIQYVSELTDEDGALIAYQFIPTLQNISYRREAIKDLIKDIFKGVNIAEIII
ncbi:transmembrane protein, putative (macronuclear) [Tetrahymena thermophila SB210]|uniref:Transmembrane protein, putative n=1 Tax=Tetrahymena thermophila (strain SB210) TaxID=312017 RepID=I7M9B6_TETTS|nr:transmembrane protein, putative [Tetrahymena thermophila SB210]EAS01277.2 transmembrane protein, putative [Tetrahymena thermophila SB210]|eukprot:XP_001021522.2 transmembrane protein, putative [Tetrahymena thermophila SB210]